MGKFSKYLGKGGDKGTKSAQPNKGSLLSGIRALVRFGDKEIANNVADELTAESREQSIKRLNDEFAKDEAAQSSLSAKFAILLDATGSMGGTIDSVKRVIGDVIRRIDETTKTSKAQIQIQIWVYRDYDSGKLLESSELCNNPASLRQWLDRIKVDGGGGAEAVEAALAAVQNQNFNAVIVVGDAPSHTAEELRSNSAKTAPALAMEFGKAKVPIFTFRVYTNGNRCLWSRLDEDFAAIAERSGGQTGKLADATAMINLFVLSILSRVSNKCGVDEYMQKYLSEMKDDVSVFANSVLRQLGSGSKAGDSKKGKQ